MPLTRKEEKIIDSAANAFWLILILWWLDAIPSCSEVWNYVF